ncbi:uncharacterized protein LOC124775587 [Schistocerca piceifrons]|uniref:uncharacterized protein LOC124775587 n=1 Tax=Schistocerca piceifrons TaxID=274613 RepID=UPI001F5F72A5|nr:uncharacterized protein LOC124775587 [Schistocerca piceifrons]
MSKEFYGLRPTVEDVNKDMTKEEGTQMNDCRIENIFPEQMNRDQDFKEEIKQAIKSLVAQNKARDNRLAKELEKLRLDLKSARSKGDTLQRSVNTLEKDVRETSKEQSAVSDRIDGLSTKVKDLQLTSHEYIDNYLMGQTKKIEEEMSEQIETKSERGETTQRFVSLQRYEEILWMKSSVTINGTLN